MDNCERGQYAEQLVLTALGDGWKWVGAGWHPWDIESTSAAERVRIQVRQSAMRQLWKRPKHLKPSFETRTKPKPSYTERDHPGILIEKEGRFCEIFIFAWHGIDDASCDQRLPEQWQFFVLPERALGTRKKATLAELQNAWLTDNGGRNASWETLRNAVEEVSHDLKKPSPPAARCAGTTAPSTGRRLISL
jgi:hypothetical protein